MILLVTKLVDIKLGVTSVCLIKKSSLFSCRTTSNTRG